MAHVQWVIYVILLYQSSSNQRQSCLFKRQKQPRKCSAIQLPGSLVTECLSVRCGTASTAEHFSTKVRWTHLPEKLGTRPQTMVRCLADRVIFRGTSSWALIFDGKKGCECSGSDTDFPSKPLITKERGQWLQGQCPKSSRLWHWCLRFLAISAM